MRRRGAEREGVQVSVALTIGNVFWLSGARSRPSRPRTAGRGRRARASSPDERRGGRRGSSRRRRSGPGRRRQRLAMKPVLGSAGAGWIDWNCSLFRGCEPVDVEDDRPPCRSSSGSAFVSRKTSLGVHVHVRGRRRQRGLALVELCLRGCDAERRACRLRPLWADQKEPDAARTTTTPPADGRGDGPSAMRSSALMRTSGLAQVGEDRELDDGLVPDDLATWSTGAARS